MKNFISVAKSLGPKNLEEIRYLKREAYLFSGPGTKCVKASLSLKLNNDNVDSFAKIAETFDFKAVKTNSFIEFVKSHLPKPATEKLEHLININVTKHSENSGIVNVLTTSKNEKGIIKRNEAKLIANDSGAVIKLKKHI